MIVLGIDSSCDETAAALVKDGRETLASGVASQVALHERFGGVVPEIACRAHVENYPWAVEEALRRADLTLDDVDGVAVTNRPGLVNALLVGVAAAKAVAFARDLPLVGVDHIAAHVHANFLTDGPPPVPPDSPPRLLPVRPWQSLRLHPPIHPPPSPLPRVVVKPPMCGRH